MHTFASLTAIRLVVSIMPRHVDGKQRRGTSLGQHVLLVPRVVTMDTMHASMASSASWSRASPQAGPSRGRFRDIADGLEVVRHARCVCTAAAAPPHTCSVHMYMYMYCPLWCGGVLQHPTTGISPVVGCCSTPPQGRYMYMCGVHVMSGRAAPPPHSTPHTGDVTPWRKLVWHVCDPGL